MCVARGRHVGIDRSIDRSGCRSFLLFSSSSSLEQQLETRESNGHSRLGAEGRAGHATRRWRRWQRRRQWCWCWWWWSAGWHGARRGARARRPGALPSAPGDGRLAGGQVGRHRCQVLWSVSWSVSCQSCVTLLGEISSVRRETREMTRVERAVSQNTEEGSVRSRNEPLRT